MHISAVKVPKMNPRLLLIPSFALLAAVASPALAQYPNMKGPMPPPQVPPVPVQTQTPAPAPAATAPPAQQSSATQTPLPAVPPPNCVAPEYPGSLAVNNRMNATIAAFNRDLKAYAECTKKYLDGNKAMVDALITANNKAVDEYNRYNENLKKEMDAASKD